MGSSLSQGRYLHRTIQEQKNHGYKFTLRMAIRTHDPSVREGEDISCHRLRGHCDQLSKLCHVFNMSIFDVLVPVKVRLNLLVYLVKHHVLKSCVVMEV
jgi:hypothetical protein